MGIVTYALPGESSGVTPRDVTSESGLGFDFGLESVHRRTRNWAGMGGNGIGPEWAQLDLDSKIRRNCCRPSRSPSPTHKAD